jgi:hypothetical protein
LVFRYGKEVSIENCCCNDRSRPFDPLSHTPAMPLEKGAKKTTIVVVDKKGSQLER